MKKLLLAGMGLLFSALVFSQSSLNGRVTDGQGNPLPGASVLLLETRQGTVADGQGNYNLVALESGTFTVRVTFVGYGQVSRSVEIATGGQPFSLDFSLEEAPTLLDALTVSATRAGEKAPFTYTNLRGEDLQSRNLGQDVPYLLDATPSVVVTSDAGAGVGYTGIRIRGTDASRINVTVNGVPINDAESQGMYWVDLPDLAGSTESIQVQRGVGTSTNGAGAFGGSIHVNTNELHEKPYGGLSASAGSFNTWKNMAKFGSGLLFGKQPSIGLTVDGRFSRITSDGYIDRASSDLKSLYFSAAWFGKKSSLRTNVLHGKEVTYLAWNGVPAQYIGIDSLRTYNSAGTEKPGEPYDNEVDDYRQTHYQLIYNQELSRNWHFNLTGHYTRGLGFYEQYKAPDLGVDLRYIQRKWLDNDFFGGIASMAYRSNDNRFQTTLGGSWNHYLGDHFSELTWTNLPQLVATGVRFEESTGDKTDFTGYSKSQFAITQVLHGFLDLQLRRVGYTIEEVEVTNPDQYISTHADYLFFNPKAGLFYEANEHAQLYASFAVAQKEPNRDDFTDAPTGHLPRAERLYNTEAGVRLRSKFTTFHANLYHMYYKNQLVLTGNINDVGAPIRINVPESYRLGLELAFRVQMTKKLALEGNATFSENKIKSFTEYIDDWDTGGQVPILRHNTNLAFSPGTVAFGKLSYTASPLLHQDSQSLTFSLVAKHVSRQYIDNTSNRHTALDAYTTTDFELRYLLKTRFFEEFSINLLVMNLLDARYSSNAWTYRYRASFDTTGDPYARHESGNFYNLTGFFPQAGRNFLAGVTVRF
ncbi:MAG: TonB-dependent receptor [Bacteroidetes bacterium]|nr:TonB-dependent receptor [Bacteroidota bacterium]